MLTNKIIRDSHSPFAAAIVMVNKKDGEMRMCIDYRQLNKITIKDRYPLPRIDDTVDALCGSMYFSTLDLLSGYWQIEIEERDKYKTAFICEFGQYEFNRMPFGLTNAPSTFQRAMNNILKPILYGFALVYLDDIIVFSNSIENHLSHLECVFNLLKKAGLKLKRKKCEFFKEKLDYLGYIVSRKGITPNKKKLESILDYPPPKNTKELSSFLGLASYYRKFINTFADKAHPLTALTRKKAEWKWGEEQRDAFNCIKNCLTSRPILSYPNFTREFIIYTDASGYGIGAVLAQMQSPLQSADSAADSELGRSESGDMEVVVAYTSKHLNDREAKWSTTEKEAYAIIHAVDVFRTYLYGRKFTVFTDHRPLEWLMSKAEPAGRLARWALKLQEFDIVIGYRPGKSHQNADTLSRIPTIPIAMVKVKSLEDRTPKNEQEKGIFTEWATLQHEDAFCRKIKQNLLKVTIKAGRITQKIEGYRLNDQGELINTDGSLIVPQIKVKEIIMENHDYMLAGHLGIAKTIARISRQYWWPRMREDVTAHINGCLKCARRKSFGTSKAPLQSMPIVNRVWERIAMDVVGPIQESIKGYKYILVLSDYASRFVFTFPMRNQTALTIADIFVNKLITKYGAPETVLTDQGTNFLSSLIKEICRLFKIKQIRTTAHHPQTDGLVERFNRTLCDMLACYVVDEAEEWDKYLPFVTLAYNTSKQATLKQTPFYLFFGREPILPNDINITNNREAEEIQHEEFSLQWNKAQELANQHLFKAQTRQKRYYDEGTKSIKYNINDMVLLKAPPSAGKFINRWNGPFIITRSFSDITYEIQDISNKKQKSIVHCNRLKPFTMEIETPGVGTETKTKISRNRRHRKPVGPSESTGKQTIKRKLGNTTTSVKHQKKLGPIASFLDPRMSYSESTPQNIPPNHNTSHYNLRSRNRETKF